MSLSKCRGCGAIVGYGLGSMSASARGLCSNCRASRSRGELVATTGQAGSGLVKLVVAGTPLLLIVLALMGSIAWYWGVIGFALVMFWKKIKR